MRDKFKKLYILLIPSIVEIIVIFFLAFHLRYPMESGYLLWQHITLGKMDLEARDIITENPFSYLPSESLIRSSWLADDVFYLLYNLGGYKALIIMKVLILSMLFILPFYMFKSNSITYMGILPLYIILVLPGTALRPGLFALLFYLIFLYELYYKKVHLMGVTILIWSFFHGSYIIGILLFGVFLIFHAKEVLKDWVLAFISLFLTFLPFFLPHSSLKIFKNIQGQSFLLRGFEEWLPINLTSFLGIVFVIYVSIWCYSVIKKKDLSYILYGGILLVLSLRFRRFIPFFALTALPLIVSMRLGFARELNRFIKDSMRIPVWLIAFCGYYVLNAPDFNTYFKRDYHPYDCAEVLKGLELGSNKRILTLQAWVPYLYFYFNGRCHFAIDATLTQKEMFINTYLDFLKLKGECKSKLLFLNPDLVVLPSVFHDKIGNFCNMCLKIEHLSSSCVIWKNKCLR